MFSVDSSSSSSATPLAEPLSAPQPLQSQSLPALPTSAAKSPPRPLSLAGIAGKEPLPPLPTPNASLFGASPLPGRETSPDGRRMHVEQVGDAIVDEETGSSAHGQLWQ